MFLAAFLLCARQDFAFEFAYDAEHLRGIFVGGACILGTDVRTNGGYLIGSADGSDAQGHSIISVGGVGGRMKSDDPRHVPPPPFSFRFVRKSRNILGFTAKVGPVDQDFETISLPFDFGLKSMDRFAFDGTQYRLFCAENDGLYKGAGNEYDFIRPKCEIRDVDQHLIGKVAGASTETPSTWGEADGPYAKVRIKVDSSTHYEKLVFMNHPGTHNLEFSFGRVKKGETASLTGQIEVTPRAGPDRWTYGANEFNHQIGRAEADGWSVRVGDEKEHYLCFGPYATEIGTGYRTAVFSLLLDNVTLPNPPILTIDVVDSSTGTVLARRDLYRRDFRAAMQYSEFSLPFYSRAGSRLEFRTLWHGISYARERGVVVTR